MLRKANLFMAWFFIPQTLAMGWVAAVGRIVLEILGVNTHEGDIPGRLVGALLLFGVVYAIFHFRRSLPPEGKPGGDGFKFGHRLVTAGNLFAALLFIYELTNSQIGNRDVLLVLSRFTEAFGYWVMALWLVGFSFLYQSSLTTK